LAKINYHDILLYDKAQCVFWDQAKLVNMVKAPVSSAENSPKVLSTILQTTSSHEQVPLFW